MTAVLCVKVKEGSCSLAVRNWGGKCCVKKYGYECGIGKKINKFHT